MNAFQQVARKQSKLNEPTPDSHKPSSSRAGMPAYLGQAAAYTENGSTHFSTTTHPRQATIEAHEAVHRTQFALGQRGQSPAARADLEAEAQFGAQQSGYTPRLAAPAGVRLYSPDPIPMSDDIAKFGERESRDLRTVKPGTGQEPRSQINVNATTDPKTGAQDVDYDFAASAKGQRGSIVSNTNLHLHRDPDDPSAWMIPTNPELNLVDDPKLMKLYPITISYSRTIEYTDDYGRTLDVEVKGEVWFTHQAWQSAMNSQPEQTLLGLSQLQGNAGYMSVRINGEGDLATIMSRDYPNMPKEIRDPILGRGKISYFTFARMDGNSLLFMSGDLASALKRTQGSFPIHLSDTLGSFVYLHHTAGEQYDLIRAYLESFDQVHIQRWAAEIEESLKNPGILVSGPLLSGGSSEASEPGILDKIFSAIADFWDSLPAPLRGTLKAIGKAVAAVAVIIGVAALVVALAPVELTVGAVALAIGAVLLIGSFFKSIVVRSIESYETDSGNPLSVFFIAIGDTFGITAIIEGSTNESVLSGRPLNLSEEEQWETGVGGGIQFILTILGARSLRSGRPTTDIAPEPPVRSGEPPIRPTVEPAPRDPFFENLSEAEIDAALGGAESPTVTGGRSKPRIDGRAIPKNQRRRLDIDDIPRRVGESQRAAVRRVYRVIGHTLDDYPVLRDAWNAARNQVLAERGPLTRNNYLELYDATRNQFWRNIRDNNGAVEAFQNAGFEFPAGRTTAPVLADTPTGISAQETRISLDHVVEKAIGNNWQRALDADNLRMEFHNPNSYRETIQSRHPDLRPLNPPPTTQGD